MRGRLDRAGRELAEMERLLPGLRGPELDLKTFLFQLLSAELALARNSTDDAISIAEQMVPPIVSMNTVSIARDNSSLLDVLARAYWKKGDLDRAEAEYERLTWQAPTDRPSLQLIHPIYHYRFARVLEEKGNLRRAYTEYEKFLELWKDADPGHPELEDARRRLAGRPPTS
jgi:tetratricopeptide (TPR) repeat protein